MASPLQVAKNAVRRLILPRPAHLDRAVPKSGPLVVAGMFRTGNGIGRAARSCVEALTLEGHAPIAVDLSEMFNQVEGDASVPLSPMPKTRSGTLILFANAPEVMRALVGLGLRRWHDWRLVGAWAWELPVAPPGWSETARMLSEMWYPSAFVRDALHKDINSPAYIVPHFVAQNPDPRDDYFSGLSERPLRILCLADGRSSLPRKNLESAVGMFQRAFPGEENVTLCLKCRNLTLFEDQTRGLMELIRRDPRIELIDQTLPQPDLDRLIETHDIMLSAHRAEGFGLHLAEAMAAGRAAVATGWSGNLEFMAEDNSVLLPYSMVSVQDDSGIYADFGHTEWAEADLDAGAAALRALYADPGRLKRIAQAGHASISSSLSPSNYSRALLAEPT